MGCSDTSAVSGSYTLYVPGRGGFSLRELDSSVARIHGGGRRLIYYANTPISCTKKRVGSPGAWSC